MNLPKETVRERLDCHPATALPPFSSEFPFWAVTEPGNSCLWVGSTFQICHTRSCLKTLAWVPGSSRSRSLSAAPLVTHRPTVRRSLVFTCHTSLSHTPARRAGQTATQFKAMGNISSRVSVHSAEPNAPEGSAPAEELPVVTGSSTEGRVGW